MIWLVTYVCLFIVLYSDKKPSVSTNKERKKDLVSHTITGFSPLEGNQFGINPPKSLIPKQTLSWKELLNHVYAPIPAHILICNHNHCRKKHTRPILIVFCGSKKEGFFVLPNHGEIRLLEYSWVIRGILIWSHILIHTHNKSTSRK